MNKDFEECNSCKYQDFKFLFTKQSIDKQNFNIVQCKVCKLIQINPRPTLEQCAKYYTNHYFTQRTHRGYNDYYSKIVRKSVERVYHLNLTDLGFYHWEKNLTQKKSLDIGCAAGYFVNFLRERNWDSWGIDISEDVLQFAKKELKVNVMQADFLESQNIEKYNLISLWATIEHLQKPKETLKKIYNHLETNGALVLSTCRYGILAKIKGKKWRFMNVPEHLYFYSLKTLFHLCKEIGFELASFITYGSGFTSKKNSPLFYRIKKNLADNLVKISGQGDMVAVFFKKR